MEDVSNSSRGDGRKSHDGGENVRKMPSKTDRGSWQSGPSSVSHTSFLFLVLLQLSFLTKCCISLVNSRLEKRCSVELNMGLRHGVETWSEEPA
jgi:hypothetical protein